MNSTVCLIQSNFFSDMPPIRNGVFCCGCVYLISRKRSLAQIILTSTKFHLPTTLCSNSEISTSNPDFYNISSAALISSGMFRRHPVHFNIFENVPFPNFMSPANASDFVSVFCCQEFRLALSVGHQNLVSFKISSFEQLSTRCTPVQLGLRCSCFSFVNGR